jgi:hypothetical protein
MAGNDRTIRVWDLTSEECLGMMAGHALAVNPRYLDTTPSTLIPSPENQNPKHYTLNPKP